MSQSSASLLGCPAPAKLNLFLHVTGRRADGYHTLQTAFRLIDWFDTLDFEVTPEPDVTLYGDCADVAPEDNLCMKAALALKQHCNIRQGVRINLHKRLPMGGGIGGGSSDAATALIALNHLWQAGLSRKQLMTLALPLGADVPFFLFGRDAFAEGIGDALQALTLSPARYVLIHPGVSVPTARIFQAEDLTRNSDPIRLADFAERTVRNDLQAVACRLYPEVRQAIEWLNPFAPAMMTGSGSCVFARCDDAALAESIVASCPAPWQARVVRSVERHPLDGWLR